MLPPLKFCAAVTFYIVQYNYDDGRETDEENIGHFLFGTLRGWGEWTGHLGARIG